MVALAGLARGAPAREPAIAAPDLRFTHLSIEHGLSHSHVWAILQDRQGFMWFGTDMGGLNRYDGHQFKVYRHDEADPRSLVHNFVWVLHEDRVGTLWVGTNGGGLDRYDRERDAFVHYRHDPKDPSSLPHDGVKALYEDSAGLLWVGSDAGLSRFDRDTGKFFTYRHDPKDPNSLGSDRVLSILEDKESSLLWLATVHGGLEALDRSSGRFTHYVHDPDDPTSLSGDKAVHLFKDSAGYLWVSTVGGLNRFDARTKTFLRYNHDPGNPRSLGDDNVAAVYEDSTGRFWVATLGGLDLMDRPGGRAATAGRFTHYRHDSTSPDSLSDDRLRTIYEDRTGAIWIGTTNGGVSRLAGEPDKFITYRHSPGNPRSPSHSSVLALHVDRAGRLWVGTAKGLNRLDRQTFTRYLPDPHDPRSLSHNDVRSIVEDSKGALWIGSDGGGLNRFDGKAFTRYRWDPRDPDSLSWDFINVLHPARDGGLWIGVHTVGLDYFDGRKFTHYRADPTKPKALPSYFVLSIFEDQEGVVWLGTNNMGLVALDRATSTFTPYLLDPERPDSEAANRVHSIHADQKGSLWLGADSGLFRFDLASRTFSRRYTRKDGLPADAVVSVLGDDRGSLWLGTPAGLSRLDPQHEVFRNYDASHGLQSNQFTWRACAKAPDGRMFFGGVNGFSAFHPDRLPDNPHVPRVVLTGFELFNKPVEVAGKGSPLHEAIHVAQEVRLRRDQSVFSIRFAALNYTSPESNRYAYKMDGFDVDWNYTNAGRPFATYTNLDPGRYVFRVRGSNNDGLWNEDGVSLRIVIIPAWWQTWWFRGLAALALLALALGAYRVRVTTLEEREQRFRKLAENAPDVVARFDRELRCRYVNPAVEEYTGLPPASFMGKTSTEIGLSGPSAADWDRALRQVFETGLPTVREFTVTLGPGPRCLESRVVPESGGEGSATFVLTITRDITERKDAEERVRASLDEKILLLQEVHHRVKNNLQVVSSLLNLQARYIADEDTRVVFQESQNRIHSMALVHQQLYQSKDLARVEAREYVRSLVANLFHSYGVSRVQAAVEVEAPGLEIDTAVPCGLLINELVSNALKHAFPDGRSGWVRVELRGEPDSRMLLRVNDTGVGLPRDFDMSKANTLGLQLIHTLTAQLDGTMRLIRDGGTTFEVKFTEARYRRRV